MSASYARSRVWPAASVLAACLGATFVPALAGDGSGTDNPTLLRGTYGLACEAGAACVPSLAGWPTTRTQTQAATPTSVPATSGPGNCATLKAAGLYSAECAGSPVASTSAPITTAAPVAATPQPIPVVQPVARPVVQQVAQPPVRQPRPIPVRTVPVTADPVVTSSIGSAPVLSDDGVTGDWRIVFKGSSTWDGNGQKYLISVSPSGELTFHRARGEARLSAGFDLTYEPGGAVGVDSGNSAFELDQALTRDLVFKTAFRLDGTRDSVNAATTPSNVTEGALALLGTAEAGFDYSAGRAGYGLTATVKRQYVGDTGLSDGATQSNADRSFAGFGLTARASYQLTPILTAYLEAMASRAYYDAVNSGLGDRADNWTYEARAGLSGKWGNGLEASLYGGYGLTDYDSGLVSDAGGFVVGGSLGYAFLRGGTVTASLDTGLTPTGSVPGATTKIAYDASLGASYLINDWVTLRGALGGSWSVFPGASYDERGLSAGVGIDWVLGTHVALNADYAFGATWTPSSEDLSHTVSVGMSVNR